MRNHVAVVYTEMLNSMAWTTRPEHYAAVCCGSNEWRGESNGVPFDLLQAWFAIIWQLLTSIGDQNKVCQAH